MGTIRPISDKIGDHFGEIQNNPKFVMVYGNLYDISHFTIEFCNKISVPPCIRADDGSAIDGEILFETMLPEVPCISCGRRATLTTCKRGGLQNISKDEFFCGRRCAKKHGFKARLVKFSNSPRCNACQCASFVYPCEDQWKAAADEESKEFESESDGQSSVVNFGDEACEERELIRALKSCELTNDDSSAEGSIDEIILTPELLDGQVGQDDLEETLMNDKTIVSDESQNISNHSVDNSIAEPNASTTASSSTPVQDDDAVDKTADKEPVEERPSTPTPLSKRNRLGVSSFFFLN